MADIPAKLVKELRDKTGAGMMDCKKALAENDGDIEKSIDWLRQKGIASAGKKSSKLTAEGLVGSYIHTGGRVGVLVEINCQTDFVARNEAFQSLVKDVAMQIAACPNVEYVKVEDIPAPVVEREKSIEAGKDDLAGKPDNVREKIVAGRIDKRLKELSLLDQPYIKDQSITVRDLVTQSIANLGENVNIRRFVRFVMGEGIEKQEDDFAAEVAAQMGVAAAPKAEPEAEPEAKAEAEPEAEPEAKAEAEPEAKAEAEVEAESQPEAKAEAKAEPKAEKAEASAGFKKAEKKDDKKKKKK